MVVDTSQKIDTTETVNKFKKRQINHVLTLEYTDKEPASNSNAKLSSKAHNEPLLEHDIGPEWKTTQANKYRADCTSIFQIVNDKNGKNLFLVVIFNIWEIKTI